MTDNDAFVASRHVGDAVITAISDGSSRIPIDWVLDPKKAGSAGRAYADADGMATFAQLAFHVRLDDASILIDTGMDDPGSTADDAEVGGISIDRSPGIVAGLAAIGVRPEDITHVLITHTHWDHFLGAAKGQDGMLSPRYSNARHIVHRGDWQESPDRADPGSDLSLRLGVVETAGLLDVIDGDCDVMNGVEMIHAPGESAGHCVVRVSSDGEDFFALGDLVHHAGEIDHPDWTLGANDLDAMQRSRSQVFQAVADSGGVAAFSHAPFPGWGHIQAGQSGFRWEPLSD